MVFQSSILVSFARLMCWGHLCDDPCSEANSVENMSNVLEGCYEISQKCDSAEANFRQSRQKRKNAEVKIKCEKSPN